MNTRRLSAFVDALATGRRPKRFRADPQDAEILRTAIALRAARPGEAAPREQFVTDLYAKLSEQMTPSTQPEYRPAPARRTRWVLISAATAAVLVTGTALATNSLSDTHRAPAATGQVPHGTALRTGTFASASGHVLGQIVAYHGHPSWVFMNVDVPHYDGPLTCMLQVGNGTTVAFGTFTVHNGIGQFSKTIGDVSVSQLKAAKLVSATGSAVATATFAS
jgi:hypothetical protein